MAKKHNSINDLESQRMRNNANALEILTKLDQSVNSNEEFVTITTTNSNNQEVNSQIPTVGFMKQRLDQVVKMLKTLAGLNDNESTIEIANNTFKRFISADINKEPNSMSEVNNISTFKTEPNWIFEEFLNPLISVEVDLTNKIADNTRYIESKRFIVKFNKIRTLNEETGEETEELTEDGQTRLTEFENLYKDKNDIDIVEFSTWLDSPGIVNSENEFLIDTSQNKIEPNRLQYKGDFTVKATEIDSVNKKLWYILDNLTYYDISNPLVQPKPIDLKVGDLINVNPNEPNKLSTTVYKVVEISTITSEFRVRFELVFGEEPIHVRTNAISYYSERVPSRTCKINVGFDEYSVLFLRQIGQESNIVSLDWSPGVGFYTNDLRLDNQSGERFSDYYINKVNDYGAILQDLVQKKVPSLYGIKPNEPVLEESNFSVVEINSHLTQTTDAQRIRDLHNKKNSITSEITQVQRNIDKETRKLSTSSFESASDRKRIEDNIQKLSSQLNTKNESKVSAIQEILANKKNLNKIPTEYRLRGFWPMPEAIRSTKTKPQEIIQFEIWYRRLSKSGDENNILTITDLDNSAEQKASNNTTITSNISRPRVRNAAFSNWTKIKSDVRKRVQNPTTGEWQWEIEDVSDADTPNINQLDIPILPGEKIQVKVKSISEVGYPDSSLESDFSNTLEYEFPDDLNSVLNEDDFILQEAQADEIKVQFERELAARGLNIHLNTAIRDADIYYAHTPQVISSGFKDDNGRLINLYDKLLSMQNEISSLRESINRAKGKLEVYLSNNGNLQRIFNSNNIQLNINAENFYETTKIGTLSNPEDSIARTYKNNLILNNNYSLIIKNAATEANLNILSYKGYGRPDSLQPNTLAYDGSADDQTLDKGIQAIWLNSTGDILLKKIASNETKPYSDAPHWATQQNNQWIWQQIKDFNGNYIFTSSDLQPNNNYWDDGADLTNGASTMHETIINAVRNLGFYAADDGSSTQTQESLTGNPIDNISRNINWQINEDPTNGGTEVGRFGCVVLPVINTFNDIIDTSSQSIKSIRPGDTNAFTIPLNLYFKPNTGTGVYSPGTLNELFIDDKYDDNGGDLPNVNQSGNNVSQTTGSLTIQLTNTTFVKPGDRIVFNGFTNIELLQFNNKILTVKNVSVNNVEFTETISNNFTAIQESNLNLLQLHKKYENNIDIYNTEDGTISSTEGDDAFIYYNVLGRVGTDTRIVNNYFELKPTLNTPNPAEHTKKLRFFLEDENELRPFDFQITFNVTQYNQDNLNITQVGSGSGVGFATGL